ncbi:MAG: hypothetical protein HYZ42_03830 [Bacteroidetes bacterium]|nr:hypothetical protein [Bacteroidota bacterium]
MKTVLLLLSYIFLTFNGITQSSVNDRLQSYFDENKKVKSSRIKVKEDGRNGYFHFNKKNKQFIAYEKNEIAEGKHIKYYYKNEQLIFIIYQLKKDSDKQRKGGLYYFVDGQVQEKEEYNIESLDPNQFVTEANKILEQAHNLLKARK